MRRNACIIWSTSPQISESKPLPPASNNPTTVQSRPAKRSRSPSPAPSKPRAIARPATISEVPGRNIRPSTTRTCGRSASPALEVPRSVTLLGLPLPRLASEFSTTGSVLASGRPSAPIAIIGRLSTIAACSRLIPLLISAPAPLRRTTTLSGRPVATNVSRMPSLIISTVAKT